MITPTGTPRRAMLLTLLALIVFGAIAWQAPLRAQSGAAETAWPPVAYLPYVRGSGGAPVVGTATATPMPTRTPTATATTTATATATATATPATRDCNGVYPIAIDAALLDLNAGKFLPPADPVEAPFYKLYSDETYQNKWQRRIYRSNGPTLGYMYLRWRADATSGNIAAMTAALTGTGTLEQGFDEVVPWPDPNTPPPSSYPLRPGRLSEGDWMYVNTGLVASSGVAAVLDYHVQHRTVLVLPIVDTTVGTGQNTYKRMALFGNFLLRGYSMVSNNSYLDLVYVGQPSPAPCTT
jgi:hypothetical protein